MGTSPQPVHLGAHCNQLRTVSRQLTTVSDQSFISLQTTMFLLLLLLALPLLCIEAVNVQDAFAGDGLVNDLKIPAPKKQLEVVYPGLFPLSPGDTLAASEASQTPTQMRH